MTAPPQFGGKEVKIGSLKMQGSFTTSMFGDREFFIRHQKMNDDLALRSNWVPYTNQYSLGNKCPYQVAMNKLQ